MYKGSIFEKDGIRYETLQDGIEHVAKNRSACIRTKNLSKCITIKQAIREGLIIQITAVKSGDLFKAEKKDPGKKNLKPVVFDSIASEYLKIERVSSRKENIYFMPVDKLRAQVYLAHGLIYPSVYDKAGLSNDFDDSQCQTPADLTLFETLQPLKSNQLLLKILLHPNEIKSAEQTGKILRLAIPLPISRLIGIGVPSSVGDINRYVDGWVKPDVPVPRYLFTTATAPSKSDQQEFRWDSQRKSVKPIEGLSESISRFDRYLGIMALLRNARRYFSEKTGYYADYPDVFFSICERVLGKNGLAPSESQMPHPLLLSLLGIEAQTSQTVSSVLLLAQSQEPYIEKEIARSLANEIYNHAEDKETLAQAFKMLFSGDYRSAIQILQRPSLPIEAAVLAGLYKFSGRQSNDQRTVKQRLHQDWSNMNQVRLVLAAIGSYHGYTSLDARETSLYSIHPLIRPYIENRPEIKFHLATNFERQLIEALYQRAFFPQDPLQDSSALYESFIAPKDRKTQRVASNLLVDSTYFVEDLIVYRYKVTLIGRIVMLLRSWKRDTIDENTEVGRYLMSQCISQADEYELSKKFGRQILRYRIAKNKVIDLIMEQKISINPRVLEVALEEDFKGNTK